MNLCPRALCPMRHVLDYRDIVDGMVRCSRADCPIRAEPKAGKPQKPIELVDHRRVPEKLRG